MDRTCVEGGWKPNNDSNIWNFGLKIPKERSWDSVKGLLNEAVQEDGIV